MRKIASKKIMDTLKANQVKPSQVVDCQEFIAIDSDGAFIIGTMCKCEGLDSEGKPCLAFGQVNSQYFGPQSPTTWKTLPFVHSKRFVGDAIGCYDDDGSGNVLCNSCATNRKAQVA